MEEEDEQGGVPGVACEDGGSGQGVGGGGDGVRGVYVGGGEGMPGAGMEVEAYHSGFLLEMLRDQS